MGKSYTGYTGVTGKLCIDGKDVAYISNWSVEDTVELIEVASLGKRTKNKVAGLRGWSASADGAIEFGNGTGHEALFNAMHDGKQVVCNFYLDATAENTTKLSGTGMIESLSVDLSAEDKGNISISISGIDELHFPGEIPPPTPPQG